MRKKEREKESEKESEKEREKETKKERRVYQDTSMTCTAYQRMYNSTHCAVHSNSTQ